MEGEKEYLIIQQIIEKSCTKQTAEEIIGFALQRFWEEFSCNTCGLILIEDGGRIRVKSSRGLSGDYIKSLHTKGSHRIVDEVLNINEPLLIRYPDPRCERDDFRFEYPYKVLFAVPVLIGERKLGVLYYDGTALNLSDLTIQKFFVNISRLCALVLDHRTLQDRIAQISSFDDLTGMYTFKVFHELLFREIKRAERTGNTLTLLIGSIGRLKEYNSIYGHIQGDIAIKTIAKIIRENIREIDIPARYGNKFIIAFPDVEAEEVGVMMKGVCRQLDENPFGGRQPAPVLSIGIGSFPREADNEKDLINLVEKRVYEAKRKTGNVVVMS